MCHGEPFPVRSEFNFAHSDFLSGESDDGFVVPQINNFKIKVILFYDNFRVIIVNRDLLRRHVNRIIVKSAS